MVRVLVIDDDDQVRKVTVRILRSSAIGLRTEEIIETNEPQQAAQLLTDHPDIELILCDVQMPVLEGHRLHAQIAAVLEERRIVFIATTGFAPSEALDYFEANKVQILGKPFGVDELAEAVRDGLKEPF